MKFRYNNYLHRSRLAAYRKMLHGVIPATIYVQMHSFPLDNRESPERITHIARSHSSCLGIRHCITEFKNFSRVAYVI